MIPASLLKWVAGKVGPRFARPLIYAAFALLLLTALGIGKCSYDRSIIDRHDTKKALRQSQADRKADENAGVRRRDDDARLSREAAELERITEDAISDADRRLARQRCIRLQQAARRDGREPPACG